MEKKINMEKIKQITLIVFGVILLIVGVINYKSPEKQVSTEIAVTDAGNRIGDVQLVSSNVLVENENVINSAIVDNKDELIEKEDEKNESKTNENKINNTEDYFTKTKLDRDEMYSKMLESYQKILDNKNIVETQKAIAIQEIDKINKAQNAILISENLIINKGFENVVVLVNNNAVNVVVKSAYLSNEEIGKIQNIVEREFEVSLDKVNISNKN